MESTITMPGERDARTLGDPVEEHTNIAGLNEAAPEPFEASIVRLDQSAAEEIFRLATS